MTALAHAIKAFDSSLPCVKLSAAKPAANTPGKVCAQQVQAASLSTKLHILGMGSCYAINKLP